MAVTKRFDHIFPAHRMKPGAEYRAWKCRNEECEQPIAPDPSYPDVDRQLDDSKFMVECPHCHKDQERVWAALDPMMYIRPRS